MKPTSSLDAKSGVPLHIQVRETIRSRLHNGGFVDASGRLMTEMELGRYFGVSRITIRHAIQPLVDEGLFARERGRGTFLRSNQSEHWAGQLKGFTETIQEAGLRSGARVLRKGAVRADAAVHTMLGTKSVWQLKRIRLADDVPIAIEHAFYPLAIGNELAKRDLVSIAMYRVFEDELGLIIREASQSIGATVANEAAAALLGTEAGSPLLEVERLTVAQDGRPLEFLRAHYRPQHFRFSITLRRQGR